MRRGEEAQRDPGSFLSLHFECGSRGGLPSQEQKQDYYRADADLAEPGKCRAAAREEVKRGGVQGLAKLRNDVR